MISIVATMVLCGINWINAAITGNIWGIESSGGEYVAWRGFGVLKEKIYPIYHKDNPIDPSAEYGFDIFSLVGTLIIAFIVVFIVLHIKDKKAKKCQSN